MSLVNRISQHFTDSAEIKLNLRDELAPQIAAATQMMLDCLTNDGKILVCGNGGSAADAQHFAAELVNRFEIERPGLAAIALTTDTSVLTSIANDYHYDQIFARQVQALGMSGDVLIAISTSGNSASVVEAVHAAHQRGMRVFALTGREGGAMAGMMKPGDINLCVGAKSTARIQEVHILALHCLCDAIDYSLLGDE